MLAGITVELLNQLQCSVLGYFDFRSSSAVRILDLVPHAPRRIDEDRGRDAVTILRRRIGPEGFSDRIPHGNGSRLVVARRRGRRTVALSGRRDHNDYKQQQRSAAERTPPAGSVHFCSGGKTLISTRRLSA